MLSIGNYALHSRVLLAPMAGVTDLPFRLICCGHGAGLATSEMVTSNTTLWSSRKTLERLANGTQLACPNSVQIAGSDPGMMAEAAKMAVDSGAQIIDINMGCPAKKVCKKLAGSALLRNEKLVANILSNVVESVSVPVTLKIRTGWDTSNRNAVEIAKLAENVGIQALAVHGRTRACRFGGKAEYDTIRDIVRHVDIPIIANGDIDSAQKAQEVMRYTGADAVMVGRAAFGNPWIFKQIATYLTSNEALCLPTQTDIIEIMTSHFEKLYDFYGDYKGVRLARKHFGWYCQNHFNDAASAIKLFNQLETTQSQIDAVNSLCERHNLHEEKAA